MLIGPDILVVGGGLTIGYTIRCLIQGRPLMRPLESPMPRLPEEIQYAQFRYFWLLTRCVRDHFIVFPRLGIKSDGHAIHQPFSINEQHWQYHFLLCHLRSGKPAMQVKFFHEDAYKKQEPASNGNETRTQQRRHIPCVAIPIQPRYDINRLRLRLLEQVHELSRTSVSEVLLTDTGHLHHPTHAPCLEISRHAWHAS